jgi:TonB family protein
MVNVPQEGLMQSRMPGPRFTLLESARRPTVRPTTSAGLSVVAHGALVALAVVISSLAAGFTEADAVSAARFLYPLLQTAPRPLQEQVRYVGLQAAPAPTQGPTVFADVPLERRPAIENPEQAPSPVEQEPQRAMSELEVDSTAMRDPDSEGPVYPPEMLAKNIEGMALVRFTVGDDGVVELATIRIIMATDSAFALAARAALPRMKFRPAWFAGRPVAQLVEQAFTFRIQKPANPL